jgi:DNA repair ATPase RecN
MFTKTDIEPTHLEKVIDLALDKLEDLDPASDEYARIVEQLDKLHNMSPKKEASLKPEMLLNVAANLAGILAILNYERAHVVTSKALGFVFKTRM